MSQAKPKVVMALYPSSRGLGYCVFNGPKQLVDWGYCDFRVNKTKRTLKKIDTLIDQYIPEVGVLEDTQADQSRRQDRIKDLTKVVTNHVIERNIPVQHYAVQQIGQVFPTMNKDARAKLIAKALPDLKDYLPPIRRPWMSTHERMQVFDAIALAMTYFYMENF